MQTVEKRQEMSEREMQQRSLAGFKQRTLWFTVSMSTPELQGRNRVVNNAHSFGIR